MFLLTNRVKPGRWSGVSGVKGDQMLKRLSLLAAVLGTASIASAQNLITNGGFETGNFSDWSRVTSDGFTLVAQPYGYNSLFGAVFGDTKQHGGGSITQLIPTDIGQDYTFSFDFHQDNSSPEHFEAVFGDNTVLSVSDAEYDEYSHYSYTVTATDTQTAVRFYGYDNDDYFWLDNVSVVAVPEPTIALVGLMPLGLLRRNAR